MKAAALFVVIIAGGWQTIDFQGLFSFSLPAGFEKRSPTKADDLRAEYYKDKTRVIVLWGQSESGAYKDRQQSWMHDYHESTTRIRGLRANIRTYSQRENANVVYVSELNLGNWDKGEVQLYMRVQGEDAAMLQVAEEIFKSIRLPLPSPERPEDEHRYRVFRQSDDKATAAWQRLLLNSDCIGSEKIVRDVQ